MAAILVDATDRILARLKAAGLRAFIDPRSVNPPCVLVLPPTMTFLFGKGGYSADYTLLAVSSSTDKRTQWTELSALITDTQQALGWAVTTVRPADVWSADQTTLLPGYEMTWTEKERNRP